MHVEIHGTSSEWTRRANEALQSRKPFVPIGRLDSLSLYISERFKRIIKRRRQVRLRLKVLEARGELWGKDYELE